MDYFGKFKGRNAALPPKVAYGEIAFAWLGGFIVIALIGYLTQQSAGLHILGSFGASCVLLFGFPHSPFSQPRNVMAGHLQSIFIGLLFLHVFGAEWWSMALALATTTAIMIATRTVHPPAGANPLIIFLLDAEWSYLVNPGLIGSAILVTVALLYNNLHRDRSYPEYW